MYFRGVSLGKISRREIAESKDKCTCILEIHLSGTVPLSQHRSITESVSPETHQHIYHQGFEVLKSPLVTVMGFPVGSVVKNTPAKAETWVQSLGQEDPMEKEMATHSIIIVWKTPWAEESSGLQPMVRQTVGHDWVIEHTCVATFIGFLDLG